MALGDYSNYKKWYTNKSVNVSLAAGDAGKTGIVAVKDANHQLFIQKITYNPVTVAAQAVTVQDSNNSHLVIGLIPASQALPLVLDYGPEGVALTAGKNLDLANTAGPAALLHIEAYERIVSGAIFVAGSGQVDTGTQPGQ